MYPGGAEIEGVPPPDLLLLLAADENDNAGEHVAELLPLVGIVRLGGRAGSQRHQDGLQSVSLGVGHQPADGHARLLVRLDEHIVRGVGHDAVVLPVAEELADVGAQRFQDVHQRGDGGRGDVPLQLGDEALGKLRARRQLLLGEPQADPQPFKNSYYSFMFENLFSKIDINADNVNFLDGNTDDPDAESARYAAAIAAKGGIDIQLLGIGRNGHIAFNEPSDAFTGESFKIALTQSTIDANSIYFDDIPMPRYAMTMGIGSIMKAKKIVLIATGASKAEAVKGMIDGEVTPQLPASILQQHDDVVIFLDEAAASLLK